MSSILKRMPWLGSLTLLLDEDYFFTADEARQPTAWTRFRPYLSLLARRGCTFRFDKNLKTAQKLGVAAVLLFIISYLLPAYTEDRGYACFLACWGILWNPDSSDLGGWLYYSGFVLTNILFVVLVVALFVTKKARQLRWLGSFILPLYVMSWSIIALVDRKSSAMRDIKVGYYVWLAAYALLFAAQAIRRVEGEKQGRS